MIELDGYSEIRFIISFHKIVAVKSSLSICQNHEKGEGFDKNMD